MVDRQVLARAFKQTKLVCYFYPLMSLVFIYLGTVMASDPSPDGPGSGSIDLLQLVLFAALAVSPVVLTPLGRSLLARVRRRAAANPGSVAIKPEFLLTNHVQLEYALWSGAATFGFVAFVWGATWVYFLALVAIGLIGYVLNFPRWERLSEYADEYDAQVAQAAGVQTAA